jgi:cytochrome c-type biogenesis protein CcsB
MTSSQLLSIATFVFALAAFFYLAALIFAKPKLTLPARWIVAAAVGVTTVGILLRWVESYQMGIGHAPLSNLYESLVFFSWTAGVIYLFLELKYKNALIGAFVTPIAFLSMAYASMSPNINDRIQPLVPALKSNWLIAHVATCFFGYAAFAVAFGMSIMYLVKARNPEKSTGMIGHIPKLGVLDQLTQRMVLFGFLFLTVGIITGSVWANSAWGSYWSWDPKETWSLITWFVYAALLHARLMRGWEGKQIAFLSILGFAAVLFTYFGVNLLPGLHSYGKV